MPVRSHTRDQAWLLPPHLEDLLPPEHAARFVAAFVDEIDAAGWKELGVEAETLGAPSYHPRLLLSVWCYGFMTGVRSSRRLEAACKESVPYLWLTGLQTPDHNTLWRFYQEHRDGMRALLKRTVRTAVAAGLLDLALQAVDGSKVGGNASVYRLASGGCWSGQTRQSQTWNHRIKRVESPSRRSCRRSCDRSWRYERR